MRPGDTWKGHRGSSEDEKTREEKKLFASTWYAGTRRSPNQSWGTFDIQSLWTGIKYYNRSCFAHWDKLRPVTTMQMQSHAPADRCTSFLPNVWASEIISTFHLLGRIWFIKWPPTTELIYKANWGVLIFFTFFLSRENCWNTTPPASCLIALIHKMLCTSL